MEDSEKDNQHICLFKCPVMMIPKVFWVAPKKFSLLWKIPRNIFSSDGTFHRRIGILRFSRNGIDDDDEGAGDDDSGDDDGDDWD